MTERRLQTIVGIMIIVCYALTIIILTYSGEKEWLLPAEYPEALYIVLPLFGIYVVGIARSFVANKNQVVDNTPAVSRNYQFIVLFFTTLFVAWILVTVIDEATGPDDAEAFLATLALAETCFGVYLGFILKSLFPEIDATDPNKHKPSEQVASTKNG